MFLKFCFLCFQSAYTLHILCVSVCVPLFCPPSHRVQYLVFLFFSCWFERKNSKCEWASWKQSSYLFIVPLFFGIGGSRETVTTCRMLDRVERSRVIFEALYSGQMKHVFHTQWKLFRMKTGNGGNDTFALYGIWIYTMYSKFKVCFFIIIYCAISIVCLLRLFTCTWYTCKVITPPHIFVSSVFVKFSPAFYAACEPLYFRMATAEHNAWCWTRCSTGEFYQLHHCVGTAIQMGPWLYL